jgi:hypothetical protein
MAGTASTNTLIVVVPTEVVMDLTGDENALLQQVPKSGGTAGNRAIQRKLGWEDDRYWAVRDALVDKNLIVRGKGRGGTVRLLTHETTETVTVPVAVAVDDARETSQKIEAAVRREVELYEPMATVIRGDWSRDRRATPLAVEITALQGRRSTGGTWSRPDIVSVEIKTYAYVPGKFLEVVTFEIKPFDSINVQAVYEALAHRRSATHSYVVLDVPKTSGTTLTDAVEDVRLVARSHGIGLIIAGKPDDYDTWDELEEAHRVQPDPSRLDTFISTQLCEATRSKIARGLR